MATTSTLIESAVEFIRERRAVTFVELEQFAASHGVEPRGEYEIALPELNVVIWGNVSEAFADFIDALSPHTTLKSCSYLAYLFDGGCLRLPLARRVPKKGYRKPHWAPVEVKLKHEATQRKVRGA